MINVLSPDFQTLSLISIDLTKPQHGVEVVTYHRNKRIWINVDGICLLRICQIPVLLTENIPTPLQQQVLIKDANRRSE